MTRPTSHDPDRATPDADAAPGSVPAGKRRRTTRRRLLRGAAAVAALVAVPIGGWAGATAVAWARIDLDTVGTLAFANPLAIPPVMDGEEQPDGTVRYDLTLQTGESSILPGRTTPTWGANGPLLAPTLRARLGQTVRVAVTSALPEPTTIHWHGMHLPAAMDGGPHQVIHPGETWSPAWAIDQPASTLWYHPHPHGETARHVYRGIAGLFLLEDGTAEAAGLPSRYGVDDIPLILQDRRFDDDGELDEDEDLLRAATFLTGPGLIGDTILVNGTYDPHLDVSTTLVRLRLLNGSAARSYHLGLSDDRPFHLVATENGLLPRPVPMTRLPLAPGERAEVVVAFTPGETVDLRSYPVDLGGSALEERFWGADDRLDLLRFRVAPTATASPPLPETLPVARVAEAIPLPDGAVTRVISFEGDNDLNGQRMDMARIDQVVPAGATEVWEVRGSGAMHVFHIHGATFRVLDIDGEAPPAHLDGPKDTILIPDGSEVRLVVRFRDMVDPTVPYMYHCHLFTHEDNGMMGQFVVVTPSTEATTPLTLPSHAGMRH